MKVIFTTVLHFITLLTFAQTVADFENFATGTPGFLNGSSGEGQFSSGNIELPNSFNPDFNSWSGWAISSSQDTLTEGFMNQYSAITGIGVEGSMNYAVSFSFGVPNIIRMKNEAQGNLVNGFYVTNGTYPFLSMRDGDGFSKKFGGLTGDDPDFFLLTIKAYYEGNLSADSVDFYLADFRFEDNSQDYIVNEWTFVDLTSLGPVDSLSLALSSTDNGMFGMNTPSYFCMDNLLTSDGFSSVKQRRISPDELFELYPNPAPEGINIYNVTGQKAQYFITNMQGQVLLSGQMKDQREWVSLHQLASGMYTVTFVTDQYHASRLFSRP